MTEFGLEVIVSADPKKLFDLAINFEEFKKVFPSQLKNIKIISKSEHEVMTEDTLTFNTYFKNMEIHQKTIHKIQYPEITSHIVEGPFNHSIVHILFKELDEGTKVVCTVNLKIGIKYKILSPVIKSKYKAILSSLIYKINNIATES
jgi:ribosome-associated toxin RatA of RatAB toxin-antitoxin module|tara:strand:+ start:12416 stop:12856 length:441 start_codon:yes stop_codon:yes gene_type:complete